MEYENIGSVEEAIPPKSLKLRQAVLEYALRKEGIASMMENLVSVICEDPDTDPQKLFGLGDEYIELIGLDEEEERLTNYTIGKYISRRRRMKEVRKAYPCDNQFFKAVCGVEPQGEVQIDMRPVTFNFVCRDPRDYALMINRAANESLPVNRSSLREAHKTGGMFIKTELFNDPELQGAVIVENIDQESEKERVLFRLHEEQHSLNSFVQNSCIDFFVEGYPQSEDESSTVPLFLFKLVNATHEDDFPISLIECKKDPQAQRLLLTRILRKERIERENCSKEELLAYLKMGCINFDDSTEVIRIFQESKRYNYFPSEWRQEAVKNCVEIFKQHIRVKRENMVKRVVEKVFVTEYEQLLIDSVDAMNYLRNAGFSLDRAIFLLMTEPLRDWRKMAERMFIARYIRSLDSQGNQPQFEVDK